MHRKKVSENNKVGRFYVQSFRPALLSRTQLLCMCGTRGHTSVEFIMTVVLILVRVLVYACLPVRVRVRVCVRVSVSAVLPNLIMHKSTANHQSTPLLCRVGKLVNMPSAYQHAFRLNFR